MQIHLKNFTPEMDTFKPGTERHFSAFKHEKDQHVWFKCIWQFKIPNP